jgi:putative endonuclease
MSSKSRVLYIGITSNIYRRAWEHKNGLIPGFTCDYRVHRLVYYENFKYVGNAIAREKEIKGWLRKKKIALIEAANPTWEDLAEDWYDGEKRVLRLPSSHERDSGSTQDDKSGEMRSPGRRSG